MLIPIQIREQKKWRWRRKTVGI